MQGRSAAARVMAIFLDRTADALAAIATAGLIPSS
jgi:hypothetical protein